MSSNYRIRKLEHSRNPESTSFFQMNKISVTHGEEFFDSKNEHLNIYYGNICYENFIVRFDLFDDICKMYPSYKINSDITKEIVRNSILENDIRIPLLKDELMIRRLEYDTYIDKRPDKIKHLHYINSFPNEKYTIFSKIL